MKLVQLWLSGLRSGASGGSRLARGASGGSRWQDRCQQRKNKNVNLSIYVIPKTIVIAYSLICDENT